VNDQITIVIKGRFEEGAFENLGKVRCCNFIFCDDFCCCH